jgi:ribosomal protein S18 acetylase RimI-like enzyme
MTVTMRLGLPADQRGAAVALYWQAFGGKLGRVMGPEDRAFAFLDRVMRDDHVIVALEDGRLLGMIGFKTPAGAFAGGGMADLRAVYGLAGGLWRGMLLRALSRDVETTRFLIDGICVSREARGRGIGTALVQALCDEARRRGHAEVRLDVIDTNWRARALYERLGFAATATERLGPLRHVFGFSSATTMVRRLQPADAAGTAPSASPA